jgi:hypothetical protein
MTRKFTKPTRNLWHTPSNGNASHWHGPRGIPVCGAGWFSGKPSAKRPANACKRCRRMMRGLI